MKTNPAEWVLTNIPVLSGKVMIVTGANSGLGFATAAALASRGAHVIMACRSMEKGAQAAETIRRAQPEAQIEALPLDLANLASIRAFAGSVTHAQIDALINNGGVNHLPYSKTVDGFETQIGTNFLGHFALTGLLMDKILAAPQGRVVSVSSALHKDARLDVRNLNSEQGYKPAQGYANSKLALLLFAYELQRRFERAQAAAISLACHPGYAITNMQEALKQQSLVYRIALPVLEKLIFQEAAMGALPAVYAAASPQAQGGYYMVPDGAGERTGYPRKGQSSAASHDTALALELWTAAEQLTGIAYPALGAPVSA
ncbi:MAG: oxidoreductase [Anaerolineae bacterium]